MSQSFELGRDGGLLIEPTLRGVGVSRYGLLPEARWVSGRGILWAPGLPESGCHAIFRRCFNRFYSYPGFPGYPGFQGNPNLDPERDWTATAGVDGGLGIVHVGLQLYGQYVEDTQVLVPLNSQTDTLTNEGNARIASLLGTLGCAASPGWISEPT